MNALFRRAGLAAAALSAGLSASPALAEVERVEVERVEVERYLGLWHEQARTPNFFEDNHPRENGERLSVCYAATALYVLDGENEIAVTNRCKRQTPDGAQIDDLARGRAAVLNPPENTHLRVAFGPAVARFFQRLMRGGEGNYWIYALGEPDADGRYAWSVVSGPDKDYIFILTREPDPDRAALRPALDAAREAGLPVDELIFTRSLP